MTEKVGIAGSGTIASGVAVAAASTGHDVVLRARSEGSIERARAAIEKMASKQESPDEVTARVELTTDLAGLAGCTFVIESVAEDYAVKNPLLEELAGAITGDAILASTTSSLSVTKLAEASGIPDRFVGFHVFNPVPVMKLVELILPAAASPEACERTRALCEAIDKNGVETPDTPGFVVNRLLFPYLFDAARFQQESGLEPEAIDTCMKLGAGVPMGPLALLDYVGIDVSIAIGESLDLEIPQNCRDLESAGKLGRKVREGFYSY